MKHLRISRISFLVLVLSLPLRALANPEVTPCGKVLEVSSALSESSVAVPAPINWSQYFKVKLEKGNYVFDGFTDAGLDKLRQQRNILRQRMQIINQRIRGVETIVRDAHLARIEKSHVLFSGSPGGAKSAIISAMMEGEGSPVFELSMHQMISPQAITGAQNLELAEKGIYKIEVAQGAAGYQVVTFDESDKGSPALYGALLRYLNEREIMVGKEKFKANLETAYASSNANRWEIHQQFREAGQGSTADAFLNRFTTKVNPGNLLSQERSVEVLQNSALQKFLGAVGKIVPGALQAQVFQTPPPLDWEFLRMASSFFVRSDVDAFNALYQLTYMVRKTNAAKEIDTRNQEFPFMATSRANTRTLRQSMNSIEHSAFLDFLLSNLADDNLISTVTRRPLKLDALSIWRARSLYTTTTAGTIRLVKTNSGNGYDIDFGPGLDPEMATSASEAAEASHTRDEQASFGKNLSEVITSAYKDKDGPTRLKTSFESLLIDTQDNP